MKKDLFNINWEEMFIPSDSITEIFLRGTITYLILFAFLRFFMKRQTGQLGIADLLVIVVIADAAQNAMSNDYKSITEGILLVGTIVFWNYALDWLGHRFPLIERLTRPKALPLILDGKVLRRNMRQEMITEEELMSQLRQQGVEDVKEVKKAYIEGDGNISIITNKPGEPTGYKETRLTG
jgi:uncharacterized membrane protein YcaP (DUF421 family)